MKGQVGPLPVNVQRGLTPSLQPLSLAAPPPDFCGCKGPRFPVSLLQGFCQEAAAADRHEGHPEELRCLPEAEKLAVVETLHQSKWPVLGETPPLAPGSETGSGGGLHSSPLCGPGRLTPKNARPASAGPGRLSPRVVGNKPLP